MKLLVIGLDCAPQELLFDQPELENIRRLMDAGCYGPLTSVIPPITVPAWMCMATSQDPGSLGVYGFRNRKDHSYDKLSIVDSASIKALAIWDAIAMTGGRSVCIGVPPGFPPRRINGVWVSCFLTPNTKDNTFTHPASYAPKVHEIAGGEYPTDVKGFRTDDKAWLLEQIHDMTRRQFAVVRHLMQNEPWDYLQFVAIGTDRIHHGFWKHHDPTHPEHDPATPFKDSIREYYRYIDAEIGSLLELIDSDTAVLILSDHGAQKLYGGFCVNEWLIREGLLVLNKYPDKPTPFEKLDVDWSRTKVWSEGGYYARVFLNIKGREPHGVLEPRDVLAFRDQLKAKLEATTDPEGKPMGTLVFKPEQIYKHLKNIPPDLIVHFGALDWRSVGTVGNNTLWVKENDTGPDDCNHSQVGSFLLAAPGLPLSGRVEDARLIDMAPTLLELAGYDIPPSMQGRSILSGVPRRDDGPSATDTDTVRDRLAGLGYI